MRTVSVDGVDAAPSSGGAVRRTLSTVLGTTHVAVNRYRLPPGERISGLHAHGDQEEVFVVLGGAVTFETFLQGAGEQASDSAGEVVVRAGEAVRFAPGEFQSSKNVSDEEAVVLALGAPPDSEDVRIPLACPECGHGDRRVTVADGEEVLVCPDCETESAVECPRCSGDDLRAELDESGTPVSVCLGCGATTGA